MSVDVDRDMVFLPTSSASPNYYGGTRPRDNRYANSIVALKGSTGELIWHFQIVHHDVWDWDVASQPMLVDVTRDGEVIPAIVNAVNSHTALLEALEAITADADGSGWQSVSQARAALAKARGE